MGREVRRVPLTFDWPLNQPWEGFLMPDTLGGKKCTACDSSGYSPQAKHLYDQWYGHVPFNPAETGSKPFTAQHPAVVAFATRSVNRNVDFYTTGIYSIFYGAPTVEGAIEREAARLAALWDNMWHHHVSQDDVDALLAAGRLHEFVEYWDPEERKWKPREPRPEVTAEQVNEWSIGGFGHDSINAGVVIRARCQREGLPETCEVCEGHGGIEDYPGQREEAENWEGTDPPEGDGWQLWETVSEGSPISPVFASAEELSAWMQTPAYEHGGPLTKDQADSFVKAGWAPSMISVGGQVIDGDKMYAADSPWTAKEDGTSGQDRESYIDDQDHESYRPTLDKG
jgi:hypothetical protein